MNRKIILCSVLVIVLLVAGFYLVRMKQTQDCQLLSTEIHSKILKANFCNLDEDCIVSVPGAYSCQCWELGNREANVEEIKNLNERYRESCGWTRERILCETCNVPPLKPELKCVKNKCESEMLSDREYVDYLKKLFNEASSCTKASECGISVTFTDETGKNKDCLQSGIELFILNKNFELVELGNAVHRSYLHTGCFGSLQGVVWNGGEENCENNKCVLEKKKDE
ncbi:MAG: hypothetical protein ABH950_01125 [Candidatus Altiarchaeota archaeon]